MLIVHCCSIPRNGGLPRTAVIGNRYCEFTWIRGVGRKSCFTNVGDTHCVRDRAYAVGLMSSGPCCRCMGGWRAFDPFGSFLWIVTSHFRGLLHWFISTCRIWVYRQSASPLWFQAPIWDPRSIFLLFSLIIFRQLRVCWCGAPSLTRGRVCNLQCNDASSMSSYIASDSLSASSSWFRAPNGAHDQILIYLFDSYFFLGVGLPHP
jgi:hypothetical protein